MGNVSFSSFYRTMKNRDKNFLYAFVFFITFSYNYFFLPELQITANESLHFV